MNFPEIKYFPYDIKLKKTFTASGGVISDRKGFFICISTSGSGKPAWGEAAPLPQFGSEKYSEAEAALKNLFNLVPGKAASIDPDEFEDKLEQLNNLPALRHGLEQAWLNFRTLREKKTLDALLDVKLKDRIQVNGLIGILSPEEVLIKAIELFENGFRTLKIKAGRGDFAEDKKCIELIRERLSENINLRIDVNGKWKLSETKGYLKELEEYKLEYIEQPVKSKAEFFALADVSAIPLAADEIIRSYGDALEIVKMCPRAVLVLKPMMLGGITRTLEIIRLSESSGMKTVISSSFETSLGRSAAIFLSASLSKPAAHGLGTKDYLEDEPFSDPFELSNGEIKVNASKLNNFSLPG